MRNETRSGKSATEAAEKYGIDTSLLEINLSRTPTERALALQNALTFADKLREAGKKYYAEHRKNRRPSPRS